jgi:hypothetical protein
VAPTVQQPSGLAPGVARNAGVGLAQRYALLARERGDALARSIRCPSVG